MIVLPLLLANCVYNNLMKCRNELEGNNGEQIQQAGGVYRRSGATRKETGRDLNYAVTQILSICFAYFFS